MSVKLIAKDSLSFDEATKVVKELITAGMVIRNTAELHGINLCNTCVITLQVTNEAFYKMTEGKEGPFYTAAGIQFYASNVTADYFTWLAHKNKEEYLQSNQRIKRILAYFNGQMQLEYNKEADFLTKAKEFCELLGKSCVVVREAAATKNGVADLLLCYNGQFVACELKRIGGVPSPQQLKFIDKVREAGGQADVCRSLADIWRIISGTTKAPNL